MDRQEIIENLASAQTLPWRTLRFCLDHPAVSQPVFLSLLQNAAHGRPLDAFEQRAFYYGVHVLGATQCQPAFKPLCMLLKRDPGRSHKLLGDAIAETVPNVLMALGKNEAQSLWEGVCEPSYGTTIPDCFLQAWAFEMLNGRLSRTEAENRLKTLPDLTCIPSDSVFWAAWMATISHLGLARLVPVVNNCLETGRICYPSDAVNEEDYRAFLTDLEEASEANGDPVWQEKKGYVPLSLFPECIRDIHDLAPWPTCTDLSVHVGKAAEDTQVPGHDESG
ncbi:hypothetical protein [Roseibium sp. RKSG952]|uniref:hypothetical protein n=1 Tax=Roseibium sp. RKSG952 TaxID=2529384 RepID=UPI0012BC517B|nr:hypothetical protein [Roseibium sp. RKSG952]MTH97474.1 hypothetical protein [Roseibium sp. RKSG952]